MRLILDFSESRPGGGIHIVSRDVLIGVALVAALTIAIGVYLSAHLLAAHWATSGATIIADITKREIQAENEDRRRLWNESIGMLEDDIAALNARVYTLYRKGAALSDYLGLPGDEMFRLEDDVTAAAGDDDNDTAASNDEDFLCRSDEDPLSVEEQHIRVSALLHKQNTRLDALELKYDSVRDQGIHNTVLADTLPLERPLIGKSWVSSRFGYRRDPFTGRRAFHAGYDYAARTGTPITAGAAGIVIFTGRLGNYGKAVHLYHGDDVSTLYGHMHEIKVQAWQYVHKGEIIGTVGSTGRSSGPHLHYEIRLNNRPKAVRSTIKKLREQRNISS